MTSAAGTGRNAGGSAQHGRLDIGHFGAVDIKGSFELDVGNPGGPGLAGSVRGDRNFSTTAGTSVGGSVNVTTPGTLLLDGLGGKNPSRSFGDRVRGIGDLAAC